MKTKISVLFVLLTAFVSCYNESDLFPEFNDDCNWETTLNDIISDNEDLFDARGFNIVGMDVLKDVVLDSTFFYDENNGYFPVYSETDSVLKVMFYKEIEESRDASDTRFSGIKVKINDLISKQNDYYFVQLTWQYGSDKFNTLALFNKRTGELEYDNMLFNMTTISKYEKTLFSRFLNEFESQDYLVSDYDEATYCNEGGSLVAFASLYWVVNGHWDTYQVIIKEGGHKYLNTYYTFVLDDVVLGEENYASSGYDYLNFNADYSVPLQPRYEIKYVLWAGPLNGFILSSFNLATTTENDVANRVIEGNYVYRHIIESPYREMTSVMIE